MSSLFRFGQPAEGQYFIGRKEELRRLVSNFLLLTPTAIIAPHGWGKSSLVLQASVLASQKDRLMRFASLDLSSVRTEERFYELLVQGVLRAVSSDKNDALEIIEKSFKTVSPKIAFPTGSVDGLIVNLSREDVLKGQSELLDFPSSSVVGKDIKLIVCVEDFHSVSTFSDPSGFLTSLEQKWSTHKNISYCLNGNGQVLDKFVTKASIFHRYGEVIRLSVLDRGEQMSAFRDRFADSGKYLDDEMAGMIVDLVENNPFYVQQLAHLSWLGTSVVCSEDVVEQAHRTIVDQMSQIFENLTASITPQQLCYIHALLSGETVISTAEVLHRHNITSATSASRSKAALLERGLICSVDGKIFLSDPIYAYWLKNRYFKY